MKLFFTVPGPPVSKKRHHTVPLLRCNACQRKTTRRTCFCGSTDLEFLTNVGLADKGTQYYENLVAIACRDAMRGAAIREPLTIGVQIEATFFFQIPKSRKKLREGDWHLQKPDVDNCMKSILDALNGLLVYDDSIVVTLLGRKFWSAVPRAEIVVNTLEEDPKLFS